MYLSVVIPKLQKLAKHGLHSNISNNEKRTNIIYSHPCAAIFSKKNLVRDAVNKSRPEFFLNGSWLEVSKHGHERLQDINCNNNKLKLSQEVQINAVYFVATTAEPLEIPPSSIEVRFSKLIIR